MTKSDTCTHVRLFSILLALLLLLAALPFPALAKDVDNSHVAEYTITGKFENEKFSLSSKNGTLFHLEDIVPGDKWTGKIKITNSAPGQMAVALKTITSDIRDLDLFSALNLNISYQGNSIYSGSYNTGMTEITKEYVLDPKETLTLDVVVTLPLDAGNEVSGEYMDSTWTFEAKYTEKPKTGGNLATENTTNLYMLWILFFAVLATAIVALRIRSAMKLQKTQLQEEPKEDNKQ